jgi:hypothetical protein
MTKEKEGILEDFKDPLSALLATHIETCDNDLDLAFKSQEKLLVELKHMEGVLNKITQFKQVPRLSTYIERIKQCKKRISGLGNSIDTIQQRVARFEFLFILLIIFKE